MTRPASQDGGCGGTREPAAPSGLLRQAPRGWRPDGPGRGPANGRPPPLRPAAGARPCGGGAGGCSCWAGPLPSQLRAAAGPRPWLPGHGQGAQSVSAGGERADREAQGGRAGRRPGRARPSPLPQTGCGTPPTCPDPRFGPLGRPAPGRTLLKDLLSVGFTLVPPWCPGTLPAPGVKSPPALPLLLG